MKSLGSTRSQTQDIAKALGILLVVYGHMWLGLKTAGLSSPQGTLAFINFAIYTFHMPLFFMLSGYNAYASLGKKSGTDFTRNRIWAIAYPYVIWSLLQWGVQMAMAKFVNTPPDTDILKTLILEPLAQFWFLYVLMVCSLLVVMFKRWPALLGVTAVVLFLVSTPLPGSPLIGYWPLIGMHFIFFAAAYLVRHYRMLEAKTLYHPLTLISAAALFAVVVVTGWKMESDAPVSLLLLPASATGLLLCMSAAHYLAKFAHVGSALAWLGQRSMGIFVMHILITASLRIVLVKLGITSIPLMLLVGTAAGIILPVIAWEVLKRLRLLNVVGLGGQAPWVKQQA